MPVRLRRKSDDSLVKAGDTITSLSGVTFKVTEILPPSYKTGGAMMKCSDELMRLPSECGLYYSTEDD